MKRRILRGGIALMAAVIWFPMIGAAADKQPAFTVTPFIQYDYLADMGGAEDVLDRVNAVLGGWLRGYRDINLFQHLLLVGAEFRLTQPKLRENVEFFASLAGTTGSTGMLGEDYDKRYSLRTFPLIPGVMDTVSLPFVDIDGNVHLRVDQYLDYYIPLQVGIRYEPHPERPMSFFLSLSGGLLFFKGGMDIDAEVAGTVQGLTINGQTDASYRGKVKMKDIGWSMSALAGMRYRWNQELSSSVAMGLGLGRLGDKVDIGGNFAGNVSVDSLLIDINAPFSINLDNSESIDLKVDGWRIRLGIVEWQW